MYAQFVIRDLRLRRRQVLVVCYPADADAAKGFISVLSPAGMALIGLPVDAMARWVGPGGEESVAQIERILFQPEATGDYVT
jgi:regulator of nucleoside diphosphate kinase